MEQRKISEAVIRRLPRYYRQLTHLKENNVERVSSNKLAQQMGLNPSQIRQDFNCFGGFGQQGYGYHVVSLLKEIERILAIDKPHKTIIVGAGNIGNALANFNGFKNVGFEIVALFDKNADCIGKQVNGKPVLDVAGLEDYIKENDISIGILAARMTAAQELTDRMVLAGIKGIWNFAPTEVVASIPVENVHLNDSIFVLSYKLEH